MIGERCFAVRDSLEPHTKRGEVSGRWGTAYSTALHVLPLFALGLWLFADGRRVCFRGITKQLGIVSRNHLEPRHLPEHHQLHARRGLVGADQTVFEFL